MNWAKLRQFHRNAPYTQILIRTPHVQDLYDRHKEYLKMQKMNMADYIKNKYLKNRCTWVIVRNSFPYAVTKDIIHKILWYTQSLSQEQISQIIQRHAEWEQSDVIYFENREYLKSIPQVKHVHIFLKKITPIL